MTLSTVAALPRGSRNELMTSSTLVPPGRLDTSDQQSLSSRSDPVVCLGSEDIVSASVPDPGAGAPIKIRQRAHLIPTGLSWNKETFKTRCKERDELQCGIRKRNLNPCCFSTIGQSAGPFAAEPLRKFGLKAYIRSVT